MPRHGSSGKAPALDAGLNPETASNMKHNQDIATYVLKSLSKRDRKVLVLCYLEERSPEEICERFDLTIAQF